MNRLFLDTEFTALRSNASLISIALYCDAAQWFYAEFTDFNAAELSNWHRENVLPHLFLKPPGNSQPGIGDVCQILGDTEAITTALKAWLAKFEQIEIWADALAYDWVLFCDLFGGALQLPGNIYYLPFDFATALRIKGLDPDIDRWNWTQQAGFSPDFPRHNALGDAQMLEFGYRLLKM